MNDAVLSEAIHRLIHSSVPDLDALELLVFLADHPDRAWNAESLAGAVRPMSESAIRQYLGLYREQKLVEPAEPGVVFRPATPELASAVRELCTAYNERPVTLIRTVYAIADARKIQAFADAFRLKKEP